MRKLLLGVMFLTLLITSCNKYADDFQALKDQIAALSTKVDGVAALQSQLTATTAQITALQAAVAALPGTISSQFATVNASLATITTKVNDLTTALNTVAATGNATKSVVDALKVTLDKVVSDKIAADAALNTKLDALQADLVAKIAAGTTANAAAIAAAQSAILAQVTASATSTDANVNAKLAAAKLALETLINANMATTNANTDAKVAAAQAAINAYTLAQLTQVKNDLTTSLNNGLAITNGKITDLAAQLETGLAGVNANTDAKVAAAQQAILALLTTTKEDLSSDIATAKSAIEALIASTAATTDGNVNSQIAALQSALTLLINTGNTNLSNEIAALQVALVGDPDNTDPTKLTIQGLQLALGMAQQDLTMLVNAAAMYNGDVVIKTDEDVAFYLAKLSKAGIVNGNVFVNTATITELEDLNSILNNIGAVIGMNPAAIANTGTVNIELGQIVEDDDDEDHHWWHYWSFYNNHNYYYEGTGEITMDIIPTSGHQVWIYSARATDKVEIKNLTSVKGNYTVLGYDVLDTKIAFVGETLFFDYPGDYDDGGSLKSVGSNIEGANITDLVGGIAGDFIIVSHNNTTGNINFPNVIVYGHVGDGDMADPKPLDNTVVFNSTGTNSIIFGLATRGQINNLTANNAEYIELKTIAYTAEGLAITAATSETIDLKTAVSSGGPVTIASGVAPVGPNGYTGGTASLVDLSNLVTSGALTAWVDDDCDLRLTKFNSYVPVIVRGDFVLTIPAWLGDAGSNLEAPETKDLTLAKYRWWSVSAPATIPTAAELYAIQILTLGNALENVNIGTYTLTLQKAVITGATYPGEDYSKWATISAGSGVKVPGVSSVGNAELNWLQVNGIMNTVDVKNLPKLTAVAAADTINSFKLDNADALLALTLDNANFQGKTGYGGPGSDLWVTGNAKLASVTTTKLNKMNSIAIHDNALLTTLNLNSYTLPVNPVAFTVSLEIFNNKLSGTYTPALLEFGTTPYKEAVITCATLVGLRNYMNIINAVPGASYAVYRVDVDRSTLLADPLPGQAVGGVYTLSSSMYQNDAVSAVIQSLTGTTVPAARTATTGIARNTEFQLLAN